MLRTPLLLLAVFCLVGSIAFGLLVPHPKGDLRFSGYPDRFHQVINQPYRVGGHWINGTNLLSYQGDHARLNVMMAELVALPDAQVQVVLHPGQKATSWQTDRKELADWTVTFIEPGAFNRELQLNQFRVDVYLGGAVRLAELIVPQTATVKSGGEIEAYVRQHEERSLKTGIEPQP